MISIKCQRDKDKRVTSLEINILLVDVLVSLLLTSNSWAVRERQDDVARAWSAVLSVTNTTQQ